MVHILVLPLFLVSGVSGEGMLGDVSVQEEVRPALPLSSAGVVCCSFVQRILRKRLEEPSESWVFLNI